MVWKFLHDILITNATNAFTRPCEQTTRQAWQVVSVITLTKKANRGKSRKSNAKFMDCHAVFQKTARNDDFLVILSLWRSIHKFKVSQILWIFRFVLTHSAQNDNSGADFSLSIESSK